MTPPATLILFDIDGTLVDVRGAGRRAFIRAIEKTWTVSDALTDVSFAGATDLGVLEQLRARLPLHASHDAAFFAHMSALLADELTRDPPAALPHARQLIDELSSRAEMRADVQLGLLTGNARACARLKVEHAGIAFPFSVGSYGDEHADRNELARRARGACAQVIVVGDTVKDIEAARAIGATAVAVCTGRFGPADLAQADVVAPTLADVPWSRLLADRVSL